MESLFFDIKLKEYPRTMTKKQYVDISHYLRTVRRMVGTHLDFDRITNAAVDSFVWDMPGNLTLEQVDRIKKTLDIPSG